MNREQFNAAVCLAGDRLLGPRGKLAITRPSDLQGPDLVAYALLSEAGLGPWEEQATRLKAWAEEREERFIAVRAVLEAAGIGIGHGKLEDQVKELVDREQYASADAWRAGWAAANNGESRSVAFDAWSNR